MSRAGTEFPLCLSQLSAHLLDLVHQNRVSADVGGGGLTSRLAAQLVQTAAGTDAAAEDDEENDSNARKTKYHGQWGIREVIFCRAENEKKKQDCCTSLWHNNRETMITKDFFWV